MKNYYVLKKIKKNELPDPRMFDTFDKYKGTTQMSQKMDNGDIYICTNGEEVYEEELRIDLE